MASETFQTPDHIVPESQKTPYYPALDGLRTVAVALVFGVHFLPAYLPFGWVGVQVFFVLSGFLITGILYDTRNDVHRFRNFYIRRTLRIFPLYYAFLFIALTIVLATHGHAPQLFSLWFVYLENFWWLLAHPPLTDVLVTGSGVAFAAVGHLWSLAVEEQFYLLWPLLVFAIRDRKRLLWTCGAMILLRMLIAFYWQTHLSEYVLSNGLIYRMLPSQCDGFLMGGVLALWTRRGGPSALYKHAGAIAAAGVLLYAALLAVLHAKPALIGGRHVFDYTTGFQATIGLPLSNLASLCLLFAVLQPGTWAFRLCNGKAMRSLGRVSYGLYVFHLPVYALFLGVLGRHYEAWHIHRGKAPLEAVLSTVMTLCLAYFSYHLFEKHFLLLKNRFTSIKGASEQRKAAHPL